TLRRIFRSSTSCGCQSVSATSAPLTFALRCATAHAACATFRRAFSSTSTASCSIAT
ncbi:hypothetical protein GGI11_003219, partial [Coemansia sp. RSA 2049]